MKGTTLALACLGCVGSHAATNEVSTAPAEKPYQLETVVVQAPRLQTLSPSITQEEMLDDGRYLNAGHVADRVPGVSSACASIDAPEPSIRGLGWERVPAQLDFLPLYGSCPARMDPPTVYLSPEAIENLTVVKGLPSATYGAGGTGGRIMARSIADPTQPAIAGYSADAGFTWNGGRDGYTSRIGGKVGNGKTEGSIGANAVDLHDYESGAGKTVPAENQSYGASAQLRFTPNADNGYFLNWNLHQIDHLDYPALPMDATDLTSHTLTFGAKHINLGETFQDLEWQAGYANSDHTMDNALKPNQPRMDASASTQSESFGGRVATGWQLSDTTKWTFGIDGHHLNRDGTRTRIVKVAPPAPGTYYDPIWPDASQGQAGIFAERSKEFGNDSRLRLGLRTDVVSSGIGRGDEATPFDPTVKDGYAKYYGSDAYDTDRNELLFGGNILWEIPQNEALDWFAGAGCVQRSASITERYYAYAPAPGGFLVGNPTLDPETKGELDGGVNFYSDRVEFGVHAYAAYIWDYILETGIDTLPNGSLVRGFENTDAVLFGGEVDGRLNLSESWSVPFAVAYTRGRNVSDDRDLPLIPPLTGHLGIRWQWDRSVQPWAEAMLRAATHQQNVDPQFPETETPGYQVIDLRGGLQLPAGFSLEAGIENLFDQDYTEHLNRTAPLPVGDLAQGEKTPMPGRFFYASVNWAM